MIRRAGALHKTVHPGMRGGKGELVNFHLLEEGEFCNKGRLYSRGVLRPGMSVGLHKHEKDFEVYYILHGQGMYNDNGSLQLVGPGDVTLCLEGQSHGIDNTGTEDLEYIALILYA